MLNENKLCSLLKATYKRGYEIIPQVNRITMNGQSWALVCAVNNVPKKASLLMVEHVGYMPTAAMRVERGCENQFMFEDQAKPMVDIFKNQWHSATEMRKIPIVFNDRWQLYQTPEGGVFGFDIEILKILQGNSENEIACRLSENRLMGIWAGDGHELFVAPARFRKDDKQKLLHIATYDWENQVSHFTAVNMNLFEDGNDVTPDPIEE